jgi:spore coat-associated protein N
MSMKKKLGLGVASAALGLSLIGGGTWAAFNDTATVTNHFASGTLDLEVGKNHPSHQMNFDLTNMKPGDNVQRIFKLNNKGTIAIKEVLLDVTAANFIDDLVAVNGGKNTRAEFLSQFVINFASVDGESTKFEPRNNVFTSDVTLAELVDGTYVSKVNPLYLATDGSNRINLAPLTVADNKYRGIPKDPADSDAVFIQITYKNDTTKNGKGEYVQNKFQGDKVDFFFNLEATQWDGVNVDTSNGNGAVNNGKQGTSEDGNLPAGTTPTTGSPTISEPVAD